MHISPTQSSKPADQTRNPMWTKTRWTKRREEEKRCNEVEDEMEKIKWNKNEMKEEDEMQKVDMKIKNKKKW